MGMLFSVSTETTAYSLGSYGPISGTDRTLDLTRVLCAIYSYGVVLSKRAVK